MIRNVAAGLKRNGAWRVAGFAAGMLRREGLSATARLAVMTRAQRKQWVLDRRRAQHAGIDIKIAPSRLELRTLPPAAHPFETAIFDAYEGAQPSDVPLIGYQHYALKRLRYSGELRTDAERRDALIWYIETYSTFRHPFKAPFSGRQIAWLLAPARPEADDWTPRIVDWFLPDPTGRTSADKPSWSPAKIAYWWCIQRSVELNVEHALIPQRFVDLLSAPLGGRMEVVPSCEFLRQHAAHTHDGAVEERSPERRLDAYIRLLMGGEGLHHAIFFPSGVLETIVELAPLLSPLIAGPAGGGGVRVRALEAIAHKLRGGEIRRSGADLSAARLGQDWLSAVADAQAPAYAEAGRTQPRGASALPFPVRVIGPLNSRSGLSQAARLSIASLQAVGVPVETVDFLLDNPAPRGAYFDNRFDVAPGPGVNLLHLSGESLPQAAAFLSPDLFTGKANIGYFFWEMPHPAECHELSLRQLDEVWVSSRFNHDVYEPYLPGRVFRVGMSLELAGDLSSGRAETRARFGLPASAFVFIATFDSFSFISRKNPSGTIRAFKRAFANGGEDVRLVIKTHNLMRTLGEVGADALRREILALCASDRRIVLINETLEHRDLLTLKSACDAYVSLHRSEGWGFGMIESMQLGLPVIATAFSGNLDFCTDATSWLVDYKPVGLERDDYIFVRPQDYWAEPDIDDAARCMRAAVADPVAAAEKGAAARRFVEATYSPEAVGAVYLERLRALGARWKL